MSVRMANSEKKNLAPEICKRINAPITGNRGRNDTLKELLVGHDGSVEDKIATVKTAQVADQSRFEAAFKKLMKG